ncbi:hypothetical protein TIFTF001_013923 [Ficus carica]|uniref:Uncharacterized protein n=1 Tax=Ficus carica TaxID=3494 RepID=A0AA88DIC7_FICCA|nr:hypothetical protein TIFTF001_013923 [Ficus carica]
MEASAQVKGLMSGRPSPNEVYRSPDRSWQSHRYRPDKLMSAPCRCQPRVNADSRVKE